MKAFKLKKEAEACPKKGSQPALEWFIDKYSAYVNTVIFNVSGGSLCRSDIEDAASDVFLVFWKNAHKVRDTCIKAYLGSVARNTALTKLRDMGRDLPLDEEVFVFSLKLPKAAT